MQNATPPLQWIEPDQAFPPVSQAWDSETAAPGLLCAGADLRVSRLLDAYRQGIFPWFSGPQPILWWSPDPRMLLELSNFRIHRSFGKTLRKFAENPACEIRVDSNFGAVVRHCAQSSRAGQQGTWIVPQMIQAYLNFHQAGFAHSVETWVKDELVGGLYFVSVGAAVFGESMFHLTADSSKLALAALVAMCRHFGITHIDCQQNTRHLASFGAKEIARTSFLQQLEQDALKVPPVWHFSPRFWNRIFDIDRP